MATALKLYEAADAIAAVREWVYENDELIRASEGALPDELAALLEIAEGDFKSKAENVGLFIRELVSSAKAVKEERDRLDGRMKHYERAAEGLKAYLKFQMERSDIPKVEGKLVTVRLQKNPPAVHAESVTQEDMKLILDEYVRVIPETRMLNSAAIIAHWKATGESPIDGVTVSQGSHVRIA
jgi:hypothetical protein